MMAVGCMVAPAALYAQEFPIAVGRDTTFSLSVAFDGTNYLVAIMGDTISQYSITAQLVSPTGSLVGGRISVGATGSYPVVAFDGSNYILVWRENNGNLKGRFINPSGNLVGSVFTIATDASTGPDVYYMTYSDSSYLVVFIKNNEYDYLYGQRISRTGTLLGGQIKISSNYARELSLAYDGVNYLVAWIEKIATRDKDVFGQFVSKAGSLVGNNFLIDGGPYFTDNPISLAFDGSRYLLVSPESPDFYASSFLSGFFITTSGTSEQMITICDSTKKPFMPFVAYGNNNYLITWTQFSNLSVMGRFYNTSGVPIDTPFVIFDSLGNKYPIGGVQRGSLFEGNKFLIVATRVDPNFTDGDVYGRFIGPPVGIEDNNNRKPTQYVLFENYPSPFDQNRPIAFSLPRAGFVTLKMYNALGEVVALLVSQELSAGRHEAKWNARGIPSGTYFYRLHAGAFSDTKKFVLLQ